MHYYYYATDELLAGAMKFIVLCAMYIHYWGEPERAPHGRLNGCSFYMSIYIYIIPYTCGLLFLRNIFEIVQLRNIAWGGLGTRLTTITRARQVWQTLGTRLGRLDLVSYPDLYSPQHGSLTVSARGS